jgi:hypothetical protein
VADQFQSGAFGGVLFKSLAVGVACCTYLDEGAIRRIYGEPVPCVNARTDEEIYQQLRVLLPDPDALGRLGQEGRAWFERHHGSGETIRRQLVVLRDHLLPAETQQQPPLPARRSA